MARQYARTFEWRFEAEPARVWSVLADTQRFNEAAGLPKHRIREERQSDGSVRFFGSARQAGFALEWEDMPVEWVDGQWFCHRRIFSRGPLRALDATLELIPAADGGTTAHYTIEATPGNLIGSVLLASVFFRQAERTFSPIVKSAQEWLAGRTDNRFPPSVVPVSTMQQSRLEALVESIESTPYGHGLARSLAHWILTAQEMDLMRIRPIVLARRWSIEPRLVIELCLEAVREGMLELHWDLLCPRCRGAKLSAPALDQLPEGTHCNACNIGYDRDFSRNVELTFRPSPSVREVLEGEFCLFGPLSTPHVKVQVAVEGGAARTVSASLSAGDYRVRTLEAGDEVDLVYDGGAFPVVIADGPSIVVGDQRERGDIRLENRGERRCTFLIESREWVHDALTADRATTLQAFRDLFSEQVLRPGDDVGIASVTLMFTDLKGSTALYERIGDAAAYRLVREHFAYLAATVRRFNGGIIKTIGDAVMAAFADPADALRAALTIQDEIESFNARSDAGPLVIKVGLHAGPCIAVTLNERLDYFGGTVNMAARLQQQSNGGDIVLSEAVAADPVVSTVVALPPDGMEARPLKGFDRPVPFHRLKPGAWKP